jgi:glycosyltransferase involved in cell wall biosynthesis
MQVTVSITTYNHEQFIAQAVNSVLTQRVDFPYEIIIGDDCSTDHTSRIVDEFQRSHPDLIRVIRPSKNMGDNGRPMFIQTLRAARGKYIAMLDGDDYWTSDNKLAAQVAWMEQDPACTMTYHNVVRVFGDGSEPAPYNDPQHPSILTTEKLLEQNWVPGCSPMIRATLIFDLPVWFYIAPWADWPLCLLATEAGTVRYINEVFGAYRIHPAGAWSSLSEEAQATQLLLFFEMMQPYFAARYPDKIRESISVYRGKLIASRAHRLAPHKADARCLALSPDWQQGTAKKPDELAS